MIAQNTLATYRGSISFDETLFIDSTDVGSGVTGSSASVMAVTVPASRFEAALVGFGGLFRVAADRFHKAAWVSNLSVSPGRRKVACEICPKRWTGRHRRGDLQDRQWFDKAAVFDIIVRITPAFP